MYTSKDKFICEPKCRKKSENWFLTELESIRAIISNQGPQTLTRLESVVWFQKQYRPPWCELIQHWGQGRLSLFTTTCRKIVAKWRLGSPPREGETGQEGMAPSCARGGHQDEFLHWKLVLHWNGRLRDVVETPPLDHSAMGWLTKGHSLKGWASSWRSFPTLISLWFW